MDKNKAYIYAEKEGTEITLKFNGSGSDVVELVARATEYLAKQFEIPYEELCKRLAAVIAYSRTFETEEREVKEC